MRKSRFKAMHTRIEGFWRLVPERECIKYFVYALADFKDNNITNTSCWWRLLTTSTAAFNGVLCQIAHESGLPEMQLDSNRYSTVEIATSTSNDKEIFSSTEVEDGQL
jgi:hypothetical protein